MNPGINARYQNPEGRAATVKILEEPERASYQKPDELVKNLEIKPGDVVADVAAGTGYLVTRLSAAVGPTGKVYQEDIVPEFLDSAREKIAKNNLTNVEVILGDERDAKLPPACCDLVLVLDSYHHFEWPEPMLASIAKALKPDGRLVIVEYQKRNNEVFERLKIDYQKHLRLDYQGLLKEFDAYGWKHIETRDFLPLQFYSVFKRK